MDFELVYSYSRKEAIADGTLIDVTSVAREAGIKYPVALTDTLYNSYIKPSAELEADGQSTEGRLWDLLFMFSIFAIRCRSDRFIYKCLFLMKPEEEPRLFPIKAVIGPGDTPEPVITIMLPNED